MHQESDSFILKTYKLPERLEKANKTKKKISDVYYEV